MVKVKLEHLGNEPFEQICKIKNRDGTSVTTPLIIPSKNEYQELVKEHKDDVDPDLKVIEIVFDIFRKDTLENIKRLELSVDFEEYVNKRLKGLTDSINIFLIVWSKKEGYSIEDFVRISSKILDNLNYEKVINDNLIAPPFTYLLKNIRNADAAFKFFQENILKFYNDLESIIPRPENLLGYVPLYSLDNEYIRTLLDFYFRELSINKFLVDFGGTNIERQKGKVFALLEYKEKIFKELNSDTPLLYFAFNTFYGQLRKRKEEVPAKDFLSLFVGFDALHSYRKRIIPKDVMKNLDWSTKVFVRKRYVYRKVESNKDNKKWDIINLKEKFLATKEMKTKLKENNTWRVLLDDKPKEVKNIVDNIIRQRRIKGLF